MSRRSGVKRTVRFAVLMRDDFTCQYCGRRAPKVALEVDHRLPVALGGTDDWWNLTTACVECNQGKKAAFDTSLDPVHLERMVRQSSPLRGWQDVCLRHMVGTRR